MHKTAGILLVVVAVVSGATGATLRPVASGFDSPLYVTAPEGDERLFVVEQGGRIRILNPRTGDLARRDFLSITDLSSGGERGLLGLAFHPEYSENGRFFVCLTNLVGDTEVREYRVSADRDVAEAGSGRVLLRIEQPFANHNGGWMGFSADGYLVISSGDGGSGNDPGNRAQDTRSLLGKILRIDVDRAGPGGLAYSIPEGNPFRRQGGAAEVWHYGVRNPWRASFDRTTGDFYFGDVGQSAREEINRHRSGAPGGMNFGWRVFEGRDRTQGISDPVPADTVEPVFDYAHSEGRSVTGGYVLRGPTAGNLRGRYVFGDFISGNIWSFRPTKQGAGPVRSVGGLNVPLLASFGEDGVGNAFVVSLGGEIFQLVGRRAGGGRPIVEVTETRVGSNGNVAVIRGRIRGGAKPDRILFRAGRGGDFRSKRVGRRYSIKVRLDAGAQTVRLVAVDRNGRRSELVRMPISG